MRSSSRVEVLFGRKVGNNFDEKIDNEIAERVWMDFSGVGLLASLETTQNYS